MTTPTWQDQLEDLLEKLGMSKSELARQVGVTYRTIARWGSGDHGPSRKSRESMAAISPSFAALVDLLPESARAGGAGRTRADLTDALAELSATVDGLKRAVASHRRRIAALELLLQPEDADIAQGARRR